MAELDPTVALLQARANAATAEDPTLELLRQRAAAAPPPEPETPGAFAHGVDAVNRQLQLAGRAGVEGMLTLGALPQTAVTAVANTTRAVADKALGIPQASPDMEYPSTINARTLDAVGMPSPQSSGERVEGDMLSALSGAKGMQAAGRAMGGKVGALLSASPDVQNASAVTGALTGGLAREGNASPTAQAAYSLLGGVAGGGLYNAAKAASLPLTEAGRARIIGQALLEQANDPEAAMTNLSGVQQFVPGSNPTAGVAAKDFGLMGAEKYAKAQAPALYGDAVSLQNQARNAYLDQFAGGDVDAMKAARDSATAPLRDAAFANAAPVDTPFIRQKIDYLLQSPAGKQQAVEDALNTVSERLAGESDPERLYSVRKDIGDMMAGKLQNPDKSSYTLAKSQLNQARGFIDNAIEQGAPGYQHYLAEYRNRSVPINQQEAAQGIRSGITTTNIDPTTGLPFLSQPKLTGIIQKGEVKTPTGVKALADALSAQQSQGFQNLASDLERANSLNSSAIRQPGADTFSNLAVGNNLATKLGAKAPFVGKWLGYGDANDRVKQQMIEGLLSPETTLAYMRSARDAQQNSFASALRGLRTKP